MQTHNGAFWFPLPLPYVQYYGVNKRMFQQILDARIKDLWTFYEMMGGLSHQGEKGALREAFLARVLQGVLPTHFGVGSGLIVDRWNRQSNQTDIIIYDKRSIPPFLEENGHGIYPIDAVLRGL